MGYNMKCPVCEKSGQKSKVFPHGGTSTLMYYQPYYDEDGIYHHHDMNNHTQYYSCSNGHRWMVYSKKQCPAEGCDFGSKESIRIIKED